MERGVADVAGSGCCTARSQISDATGTHDRAGAILDTELVARAPADGHTLGIIYTPYTVLSHLQKKLPYDALKDFAAVSQLTEAPLILVVHPSLPVHKVQDLIALAKSKPLVYGSAGNGSGGHLSGELLK